MEKEIIIFDGECTLCNNIVNQLWQRNLHTVFQYVPFQSQQGQIVLHEMGFETHELNTVILIDQNGSHIHSDAFLRIMAKVPSLRKFSRLLTYVPKNIRDGIYKLTARNRVKWFGKSKHCAISL